MDLEKFNNKYLDKLAIIIAPGPSVLNIDFSLANDFVTFAVNSGILAYPDADFFVSDDKDVVNWNYFYQLRSKTIPLLYEDKIKPHDIIYPPAVYYKHRKGMNITDEYIHNDYNLHICEARTSVGSAIHIAHIMGCSPIVLLGVDCCLLNGNKYFWENLLHVPKRIKGVQRKFVSKIRVINDKCINIDSDLEEIRQYWIESSEYFLEKIDIYNCSTDSCLDVFPLKPFEDICHEFKGKKK